MSTPFPLAAQPSSLSPPANEFIIPLTTKRRYQLGIWFPILGLFVAGSFLVLALIFTPASATLQVAAVVLVAFVFISGDYLLSSFSCYFCDKTLTVTRDGMEIRYAKVRDNPEHTRHSRVFHLPLRGTEGGMAKWKCIKAVIWPEQIGQKPVEETTFLVNLYGQGGPKGRVVFVVLYQSLSFVDTTQVFKALVEGGSRIVIAKKSLLKLQSEVVVAPDQIRPLGLSRVQINT
jgi:hypothetical protein